MKGFQVKHLPQETQTFISNRFYCWTRTSQNATLHLRLEMRSWQRSRLSTALCPGGVFLFIHHLHTEESLSVRLQLQVSLSSQCAPLVESWGQISGLRTQRNSITLHRQAARSAGAVPDLTAKPKSSRATGLFSSHGSLPWE